MSALSSELQSDLQPFLVSVRKARELLGGIGNNKFWQLAKCGELELVGTERKRWVVYGSIERYVARLRDAANAGRAAESPSQARTLAETLPQHPDEERLFSPSR
jgi:hypothetical protein